MVGAFVYLINLSKQNTNSLNVNVKYVGESDTLNITQLVNIDVNIFIVSAIFNIIHTRLHHDWALNEKKKF